MVRCLPALRVLGLEQAQEREILIRGRLVSPKSDTQMPNPRWPGTNPLALTVWRTYVRVDGQARFVSKNTLSPLSSIPVLTCHFPCQPPPFVFQRQVRLLFRSPSREALYLQQLIGSSGGYSAAQAGLV